MKQEVSNCKKKQKKKKRVHYREKWKAEVVATEKSLEGLWFQEERRISNISFGWHRFFVFFGALRNLTFGSQNEKVLLQDDDRQEVREVCILK